jgi:ABC-type taurine transport system ATPase subunit
MSSCTREIFRILDMSIREAVTLVVIGASGAGKTAAVRALAARTLPDVACFHFDTIGVPSPEVMLRDFGGGEAWQAWATNQWLDRLERIEPGVRVAVLDGQTRPSFVLTPAAGRTPRYRQVEIVLLDCERNVREERLRTERQQPELITEKMQTWAAYLRGQADALNLAIVDTTTLSIVEVADRLQEIVTSYAYSKS